MKQILRAAENQPKSPGHRLQRPQEIQQILLLLAIQLLK
jgi:hypothetical protein